MIKDYELLIDQTKSGNYLPWKEKKLSNVYYYELLHILQYKKAMRVKNCAEVLEFKQDVKTGHKTLFKAWFCKSRLCPLCNWRRTMKHGIQSEKVITEVVKRESTAKWLFLTLSVKNAYDGDELDKSFREMTKAFSQRFIRYKKISKNLIGYMRASEVTVNDIDNSYNQHIHVLMCVKSSYFNSSSNYITQAEYRKLWRRALKIDYDPYVHIKIVRPNKKYENEMRGAINEVAKYPVKETDYMTDNKKRNLRVLDDLEQGLRYKRLIGYGGLLREIHRELNLDDAEDGNLTNLSDDYTEAIETGHSIFAVWNFERQNYFIKR